MSSCEFLGTRFATIRHLSVAFLNAAGKFGYDFQAKSRIQESGQLACIRSLGRAASCAPVTTALGKKIKHDGKKRYKEIS